MAIDSWDIFQTDQLESRKGLTLSQVRAALASGKLREDDLIRPGGSSEGWKRIGDHPGLAGAGPSDLPPPPPPPPRKPAPRGDHPSALMLDDLGEVQAFAPASPERLHVARDDRRDEQAQMREISEESREKSARRKKEAIPEARLVPPEAAPPAARRTRAQAPPPPPADAIAVAQAVSDDDEDEFDDLAEDAEAAEFTLSPQGGKDKEEDLDLAAMVDVAFQLIMFFIVTAASVFFKSIEIPTPHPDKEKTGQQAVARTIEDLANENILVEIDRMGQIQVNHKPVAPENLIPEMRSAREESGSTAMLLMADMSTPHKNVVAAYDAASEIGLSIKVGRVAPE